jgi:hypothetical protein
MYCELVERDIKNRNLIKPIGDIGIVPTDYCRYISLFPFEKNIIDYINVHKTIKGHKGLHYVPYICFDIDNEKDLDGCQKSVISLCDRLETLFDIYPDELRLYFSGNKGFHIVLHENLFGKLQPSNDIAEKIKTFVIQITEGIENIDLKIYENHRIIRVANSKHEKSIYYKIPLHYEEVQGTIESILELAKNPRPDFKAKKKISELVKKEKLSRFLADLKKIEIYNTEFELNTDFFKPPAPGERNSKLHKQACTLFCNTPFKKDSIIDILQSINIASGNPISINELKILCNNAEKFAETQPLTEQELQVKSFGDWTPDFIESLREEDNKITLCLPSFDKEMKGKLRGKLLSLIGYGGTKKSLYSENICYENIIEHKYRCLYSSMEMGVPDLMRRFIDMSSAGVNYNNSFEVELAERKNPGCAQEYLQKYIIPNFTNKLLISPNSSMTVPKYRELIKKINIDCGVCDILIVDGLSMMGGTGKTIEQVDRNSRELKELALEFNIFVIMITHVSRGADKDTKDLSMKARDSEKIVDNCDFHISLSQIYKDKTDQKLFDKYGHARLVNKRGSGKTVDVNFEIDEKRLLFKELSAIDMVDVKKQIKDAL